nr:hypothetical protein [Saccharopolyspora spinosa]
MNRAPAKPVSTAAANNPGSEVNTPNSPNETTRIAQPVMIIGRHPSRSAAVPPTRYIPCWLRLRTPSSRPITAAP